ncbi:MAG: AmmeMemoRadiSam system radical SAM enzyme [Anaerolineae bacterium]|nr:AmmeMemoRadiSam system radical SAM enzyme [Anaerolineae bacterium]
MTPARLLQILDAMTTEGRLYERLEDNLVRCYACAHGCLIQPGRRGICRVRFNQDGILRVPWGYVAGAACDPIEKKPYFHVLPGRDVLTFGMLGCNFHCSFCQNWLTSQTLRDPSALVSEGYIQRATPEQLVAAAQRCNAPLIASSYNEPLITSEWAVDIFRLAKQQGMRCVYVSNGFTTPEALRFLRPHLDGFKVDLKTMQARQYKELGGALQPVLDSIKLAHELGLWVEVVTLVVPGFNDTPEELWEMARFLVSVSPDIPWHVTAFHPDYKMTSAPPTSTASLQRAADIGQEAGLHYVYAGNLPGRVGSLEDTFCPACRTRLIQRRGFSVLDYKITPQGTCPACGAVIAGIWSENPPPAAGGTWGQPRRVSL